MQPSTLQLTALAAAWIVYGALHSFLAATVCKQFVASRWPRLATRYRLTFNIIAAVTLLPPLWMMYALNGNLLWQWSGHWGWLADALALSAVAGFFWTTRYYNMPLFLGTRQGSREMGMQAEQGFVISPLHRIVRHPWYFLALIILWTRDMDAARLVSTSVMTLYFALGSYWEERKLIMLHGDTYRTYRGRVPGLVPLPWKFLRAQDMQHLTRRG